MNILICSQYGEAQVEDVSLHLRTMGANPVIFERYRKDQFISYHYDNATRGIFRIGEQEYSLCNKTFPVVWYRPKPIILSEIPGEVGRIKEKFCVQEWRVILQSLDIFLSESNWINPISSNQRAANKAYQLKCAQEFGLRIPPTVITNDASKTVDLFNGNRVIYKTLSSYFSARQAIYTNEIEYDQVIKNNIEIAMAPGIFQKYIEKKHELRITIVGQKLFIVQINSQLLEDSSIDWRRCPDTQLYQVGELSDKTTIKLLALHKGLDLVYGAYDFIVDQYGHEIFIECNPSGQWLWLDDELNLGISRAIAEELISLGS